MSTGDLSNQQRRVLKVKNKSIACEVCGSHDGVFQCSIPSCKHAFHYHCMKDVWCLFFHATTESVSFFVCCSEHLALIPSVFLDTHSSSFRSHTIPFSQAPGWLHNFNRTRCRVSLCTYDLMNNTKEYQALRSVFIQCGLQEVIREPSIRKMKRQMMKLKPSTVTKEKKDRRTSVVTHTASKLLTRNRRFNYHLVIII